MSTRRKRFAKIAAWAAAAAVLLGFGTYSAKPFWQHWWFAHQLCGGTLSADDLGDVLPDERLRSGTNEVHLDQGRMTCRVDENDGNHFVLSVDVNSDPSDVEFELNVSFTIPSEPGFVFPDGIPGFQDDHGPVILQECPALKRDEYGRKRRLLTKVIEPSGDDRPSSAALRIAVSAANAASERSGCGAKPLPSPESVAPAPENLSLAEAADTECGWLAEARLPRNPSGKPWKVQVRSAGDTAPITSCALVDSAKKQAAATFTGWYGTWSDKQFETLLAANVDHRSGQSSRGPMMAERLGRATARCDGESANYEAYSHSRDTDITHTYLTGAQLRPLLVKFTQDQAHRRGCTGLKLPDRTINPMAD
ncbi:hypothetical protein ACQB60_15750 [Actinomycetota bacterium Odt1-20B]